MTSKISHLFPIGATPITSRDLEEAADAIQVLWAYLMTGLTLCDDIHPKTIANIVGPLAAATGMASTTFGVLAGIADQHGTRTDLYEHTEGPLNDCTDMAAALLREASTRETALGNKLDDIGRFTSCAHLKQPKSEAAQQDS